MSRADLIIEELTQAISPSAIRECYENLEQLILESEEYPELAVDVVCTVMREAGLYNRDGISEFIFLMLSDMYRMSAPQRTKFIDCLLKHFSDYRIDEFCWVICDFVSRNFQPNVALEIFAQLLFQQTTSAGKRGLALGLQVLARNSRDPQVLGKIRELSALLPGATGV